MENLHGIINESGQGTARAMQQLHERVARLEEQVRVLRVEQSVSRKAHLINKVDKPTKPEKGAVSFYARDDGTGTLTVYYQRPDGTEVAWT